jgi:2-amino-4-hydroxy-6-hydroxymethyldihydropteridine diphosphokinase
MGITRKAYLSLGSNLGDRFNTLQQAVLEINNSLGKVTKVSAVYETEPVGFNSTNFFLNACILIETELDPLKLLEGINKIEHEFGRFREITGGYISRTLDIDILFYEDVIIDNEKITIPHPRLRERLFVLMPLCDLDNVMIDPISFSTTGDLLKKCQDTSQLTQFDLSLII